jgi:hypothetical protein
MRTPHAPPIETWHAFYHRLSLTKYPTHFCVTFTDCCALFPQVPGSGSGRRLSQLDPLLMILASQTRGATWQSAFSGFNPPHMGNLGGSSANNLLPLLLLSGYSFGSPAGAGGMGGYMGGFGGLGLGGGYGGGGGCTPGYLSLCGYGGAGSYSNLGDYGRYGQYGGYGAYGSYVGGYYGRQADNSALQRLTGLGSIGGFGGLPTASITGTGMCAPHILASTGKQCTIVK